MRKVLDAWAVIAWLEGEPSGDAVEALLSAASQGRLELFISMINAGEVYYRLAKRHGFADAEDFLHDLDGALPVKVMVPDREMIVRAARLKGQHPISYADAFAAATSLHLAAPLVTGDPELRTVAGLRLEWLR